MEEKYIRHWYNAVNSQVDQFNEQTTFPNSYFNFRTRKHGILKCCVSGKLGSHTFKYILYTLTSISLLKSR